MRRTAWRGGRPRNLDGFFLHAVVLPLSAVAELASSTATFASLHDQPCVFTRKYQAIWYYDDGACPRPGCRVRVGVPAASPSIRSAAPLERPSQFAPIARLGSAPSGVALHACRRGTHRRNAAGRLLRQQQSRARRSGVGEQPDAASPASRGRQAPSGRPRHARARAQARAATGKAFRCPKPFRGVSRASLPGTLPPRAPPRRGPAVRARPIFDHKSNHDRSRKGAPRVALGECNENRRYRLG
jgi:hypothetical protein